MEPLGSCAVVALVPAVTYGIVKVLALLVLLVVPADPRELYAVVLVDLPTSRSQWNELGLPSDPSGRHLVKQVVLTWELTKWEGAHWKGDVRTARRRC